jgi:hypothetical protein
MAKNLQAGLRQSIKASSKASLVGSNVFGSSSLDLRFALQKTLDPRVTFTRASAGTYVGSDGLIKSATTNEARFDHNPITGESLGLLVEEQRTNLSLRSQELDNTTWTKTASSVTANAVAAPDGTTTADKLVEDSATTTHSIIEATATSYIIGQAYTFSFFINKAERQTVQILMHPNPFPGTVAQRTAVFNSNTGAFVSVGSGYTGSSATALSNGWFRVSVSSTADATTTGNFMVTLCSDDTGTTSYTGNGTSGLFLWGAQLEAGAFATSYIPTTSATVTRAADVASITGTAFSSWYRQDEGTVFASALVPTVAPSTALQTIYAISDGSTDNRISAYKRANADTSARLDVTAATVSSAFINAGTFGLSNVIVSAVRVNDFAVSLNGLAPVADTSGNVPSVNQINLGTYIGATSSLNGHIRRLTYWPVRLANPTLQSITTP